MSGQFLTHEMPYTESTGGLGFINPGRKGVNPINLSRPMVKSKGVRELATVEELEERIKKLEERISIQDKVIKKTLDFVQQAIDTQFKQSKEDQEWSRKESAERMNRIMKELGYKTD